MKLVKKSSFIELAKLTNKKIHFTSNCEFFPNFDVKVFIYKVYIYNDETIFETTNLSNNKHLTIGSNMKNLKFEII